MKIIIYRVIFAILIVAVSFLAVEIAARAYFSWRVGPDMWAYGIGEKQALKPERRTVRIHASVHDSSEEKYTKYLPYQERFDIDKAGNQFKVTINGRGFRGPDYTDAKPEGTARVVTLGASSTFGYYDRDTETYPYYMNELLNEKVVSQGCGAIDTFEVINLGIPHLKSGQILSILREEGIPLSPDVVTFYEGINNATYSFKQAEEIAGSPETRQLIGSLGKYFITFALIANISKEHFWTFNLTESEFEGLSGGIPEKFVSDLSKIRDTSQSAGALLFVATQQAKSDIIPKDKIRGIRYGQEVEKIQNKLIDQGELRLKEVAFLVHNKIMQSVYAWGQDNEIVLVDIISTLDDRRDMLLSWVHLSPEANRIVARDFSERIFDEVCSAEK